MRILVRMKIIWIQIISLRNVSSIRQSLKMHSRIIVFSIISLLQFILIVLNKLSKERKIKGIGSRDGFGIQLDLSFQKRRRISEVLISDQ